ncbi:MAG: hypothetical protein ACI4WG_01140 [Erysipelotrichaceae bacterium]
MIINTNNNFLKRYSKRICIVLVGMIVFVNCFSLITVFAGESSKLNSGITFTYNTKKYEASKKEIQEYEKYGIKNKELNVNYFIDLYGEEIDDIHDMMDNPDFVEKVSKLLLNYQEMKELSLSQKIYLFIHYISSDGKDVYVDIMSNGCTNIIVYDEKTDVAYLNNMKTAYIETHYREGYHFEMSDQLVDEIYSLIENGNIEEAKKMQGIAVTTNDRGETMIEPDYDYLMTTLTGYGSVPIAYVPANDTQLLSELRGKFPEYTNKVKTNQQLMCSPLNSSVAVKVTETRNTYTKVSVNWVDFAIGTALSVVASSLNITSSGVQKILDALNIAYSVAQGLLESARLSKAATYSYRATKRGCVYDKTVYNKYVLIVRYAGTDGRFQGGFLNTGEFNWVDQPSSVYSRSDSSVLNTALTNYSNDLIANNNLTTYLPEYSQWSD